MKITFGLALDGWEPLKSPQCLNEYTGGPAGFLELLEVRLGLKTNAVPLAQRLLQYKALLEKLAKERVTFYTESYKKDPYAVAETLVGWRDGLIMAGWDGVASGKDSARLQDMSALEARTPGRLAPGMGDRLRTVLRELPTRSPRIDVLTVMDEPEHLPSLWRQLCEKIGAHYAPINDSLMSDLESGDSDLARIQSLVDRLGNQPVPKIKLKGDQSIICLTAFSEYTLARGVAQWLRQYPPEREGGGHPDPGGQCRAARTGVANVGRTYAGIGALFPGSPNPTNLAAGASALLEAARSSVTLGIPYTSAQNNLIKVEHSPVGVFKLIEL